MELAGIATQARIQKEIALFVIMTYKISFYFSFIAKPKVSHIFDICLNIF